MKTRLFEQRYENREWSGYTKFLPEVIAVKVGVKPVMRIPVSPEFGYEKFSQLCKNLGVLTGLSDYKIKAPYTKTDIQSSSEGDNLMYVSMEQNLIDKAKRYDLFDEDKFGELMGYPKCCIDYYNRIMNNKPIHETYMYVKSGKKLNWHNNYLLRFNSNYYLHAYFVCSFDCKESIKNAKGVLKGIKEFDPVFAQKIEHHLKLPILFDDSRPGGILYNWNQLKAVVFDGDLKEDTIEYDGQFALWEGHHFPLFSEGDKLTIAKDHITLSKHDCVVRKIGKPGDENGFIIKFD